MIRTFFLICVAFGMGLAATTYVMVTTPGILLGLALFALLIVATIAVARRPEDQ